MYVDISMHNSLYQLVFTFPGVLIPQMYQPDLNFMEYQSFGMVPSTFAALGFNPPSPFWQERTALRQPIQPFPGISFGLQPVTWK